MELPQVSICFKFSSEMSSRTSSQMCGRWYLPMFLLRDGLFTLMYRASFMVLKRFWSSLPSMEKLSIVTLWPQMLRWSCIGDGALRCSLYLSSKFLADSPIYSSSQSTLSHLYLYIIQLQNNSNLLYRSSFIGGLMSLFGLDCARLVVFCLECDILDVHIWLFCTNSSFSLVLSWGWYGFKWAWVFPYWIPSIVVMM